LVERFYDPIEGGVFFSGVNIKDLDPRWYKNQIAIVSQEPVLFSGTIKQNICYGLDVENITEKELEEACSKANALTFISDK
jgi:ATP-binding cassette subfamily B (MDR/TAP) protein 1